MRRELEGFAEKLREQWCESLLTLPGRGSDLLIGTPFLFSDGDEYPIHVEFDRDRGWRISDHGLTLGRAFSDTFDSTDSRMATMEILAGRTGLAFRSNELVLELDHDPEPEDIALFISCVARLTGLQEQVADTTGHQWFTTRVRDRVTDWLAPGTFEPNWRPARDRNSDYRSDLLIKAEGGDLAAFFVGDTPKGDRSALTAMQYQKWNLPERPIAAVKDSTVGHNSRTMHVLQEALGQDRVIRVQENLEQTGYLSLRRGLAELGVPLAA